MPPPGQLREFRCGKVDQHRLLMLEDLMKFERPGPHLTSYGGGKGGRRSEAVNLILSWAKETGVAPTPPDNWFRSQRGRLQTWILPEFADGMSAQEIGVLISRGLSHYLRDASSAPTPDGIGRKIAHVERDVRLPLEEVREIWREAFRMRRDPRDVIAERMRVLVEDAVAIGMAQADLTWVKFPSDPASERRIEALEEIASDNGDKAEEYLTEAALRRSLAKRIPGGLR